MVLPLLIHGIMVQNEVAHKVDNPHYHGHPQDVRYEPDFRQYPHYYHAPEGGQWQRGGYLPRSYWGPNYRINNWQDNGLPPPPTKWAPLATCKWSIYFSCGRNRHYYQHFITSLKKATLMSGFFLYV